MISKVAAAEQLTPAAPKKGGVLTICCGPCMPSPPVAPQKVGGAVAKNIGPIDPAVKVFVKLLKASASVAPYAAPLFVRLVATAQASTRLLVLMHGQTSDTGNHKQLAKAMQRVHLEGSTEKSVSFDVVIQARSPSPADLCRSPPLPTLSALLKPSRTFPALPNPSPPFSTLLCPSTPFSALLLSCGPWVSRHGLPRSSSSARSRHVQAGVRAPTRCAPHCSPCTWRRWRAASRACRTLTRR